MNKSYLIAVLIAAVAGAWILSGQIGNSRVPAEGEAETAAPAEPVVQIMSVRVRKLTAQTRPRNIVVKGRTEASRSVNIRAQTRGHIDEVAIAKGARLEAEDVIVRLSADDRPARLAEAKAVLAQRRIEYKAARALSKKGYRAETKLAESRALLEVAKAGLARISTDIAHTEIKAPFAGVLEDRPVEIGDFVDIGDPLATLVDLDPILVVAYVSERDIRHVETGAPGHARLITGEAVSGRIRFVSAVADPVTRTYRVELEVGNPELRMKEGSTAELQMPLAPTLAHLVSPAILSLSDDGVVGVKLVNDANVVEFHPAQILGDGPDGVWLNGLPQEITVITVGQDFVRPGDRVDPQPAGDSKS